MSDRHDYYFGEVVTESELDEGFDYLEQADWDMAKDGGITGITVPWYDFDSLIPFSPASWLVQEDAVPSWLVRVTTGYAYDKLGRRIAVDPAVTVTKDCSVDYLGASNAVAAGNERYISLFVKFARDLSDPRTDDDGITVWFQQDEDYTIEVRQGPEELAPAVTKPARDSEAILIADILISNATPPILNAAIDRYSRPEFPCRVNIVDIATSVFGLVPAWWPFPTPGIWDYVLGRNPSEAAWFVLYDIAKVLEAGFLTRHGDTDMEASLLPDVTCTHDLGSAARKWQKLHTQGINEAPGRLTSGTSIFEPDDDWDDVAGYGHSYPAKVHRMITGSFPASWIDLLGRMQGSYLDEVDDFLRNNDPDGTRYTLVTPGGGTATPNSLPYALTYPGGFIDLLAPAAGGSVSIIGLSYPLIGARTSNLWQARAEHGIVVIAGFPAASVFFHAGLGSAGGVAFFTLIYDPSSVYLTAGNANWWAYYDDGGGNTVEFDTGTPFAAGVHKIEVAFERNASDSHLWLCWYRNSVQVHRFDLTAAGGTWLAVLATLAWDKWIQVSSAVALSDINVLWDYVRIQQFREDLL